MSKSFILTVLITISLCFVVTGCTVRYVEPPRETTYDDPPPPPPPPPPSQAEMEFYELGQYGDWIEVYPYGTVWRPQASYGWRPYVYGHWAWTDWDWMWVSYEPFGWAVYHYGYWQYDPDWGWIWIPGLDWHPVLVQWAYYDDYVCWAPLPPPGHYLPDPWVQHHAEVWMVVHFKHFTQYDLHRYRVKPSHKPHKYKSKVVVHRNPPPVRMVEKYTRRSVQHIHVDTKSYKSGKKTYKKVVLPPSERKIVQKYEPRVKHKVTKESGNRDSGSYKENQERGNKQQPDSRSWRGDENTRSKTRSKSSDPSVKRSAKTRDSQADSKEPESKDEKSRDPKSKDSKSKDPKSKDPKSKDPKSKDPKSKDLKSKDPKSKDPKSKDPKSKDSKSKDSKRGKSNSGDDDSTDTESRARDKKSDSSKAKSRDGSKNRDNGGGRR